METQKPIRVDLRKSVSHFPAFSAVKKAGYPSRSFRAPRRPGQKKWNHTQAQKNIVDIFAIVLQNYCMWIARKYEKTLRSVSRQFPAVVLTGPRQVGKTSLVKKVFPDLGYASLDVPSLAAQAETNPETFLKGMQEPLVIDEVQYAPSLLRHLKSFIDRDKRPGRFILTGSQNFVLMQGVSESLAGRAGVLSMLNLSARELKDSGVQFDENIYLFRGGFPELYSNPEVDASLWYSSYLSTYLERDVRNLLNVGSLRDFDRFLRAIAIRTSQILSYSELARDVGIAPNTAKKWISVLEASGQILLLEPYHRSLGKRLVKSPKVYMCDTGLAVFLMGFQDWDSLVRHPVIGALWETHVLVQVVKHFASQGKRMPIWFWRTPQGAEVDLLIEQGGRFIAVECKFSEHPDGSCLKGMTALQQFYGKKSLVAGYIASRSPNSYSLSELVTVIPGSLVDSFVE